MLWSSYRRIPGADPISSRTLREILDGGQAFRWREVQHGVWQGIWERNLVRLTLEVNPSPGWPVYAFPESHPVQAETMVTYWGAPPGPLPPDDPVLEEARALFPGLRLLRQPFWETVLGFLSSSNKQILQIKQILEHLAQRLGRPIAPGHPALPTPAQIRPASLAELQGCALGYRARYLFELVRRHGLDDLEQRILASDYPEARNILMELPGIGPKVADCILLFGAGKIAAFPIDTWMEKILVQFYGLSGCSRKKMESWGRDRFGPSAGLAQQYLFALAREKKV